MMMLAEADLVGSVIEVAVMVTVPPRGIAKGAAKVVWASEVVSIGLKEPQVEAPQVTLHWTLGLAETSLRMAALSGMEAPTSMEAGTVAKNETEMGMGGTMVTVAEMDLVVSATAVAVMVTVPPAGMAEGAV